MLYRLELSDPAEVESLLTEADYEKYLKECEEH